MDGYREPEFFLSTGDPQELTDNCVEYLLEISAAAQSVKTARFAPYSEDLAEKIEQETDGGMLKELQALKRKLDLYTAQLPCFGWSSSRFDILLLRSFLFKSFENFGLKTEIIIKKGTSYLLLATDRLVFKDMQSLVSPTASYANWLISVQIAGAAKSVFPFTWFDSLSKLAETRLPHRSLWTNNLKNKKLSDDDWNDVNRVWTEQNMTTMADFLRFYNNGDVSHFVLGVEKQREFWVSEGICMLTDGVSLSGLSLRFMDKYLPSDRYFALPRKEDYSFVRRLRKSICGGLSQVFHRIHVSGVTRIRRNLPTLCRSIQGYDFNSLYLTEMGMPMPHGIPYIWTAVEDETGRFFHRDTALPNSVSAKEVSSTCLLCSSFSEVCPRFIRAYFQLEWLSYESWSRNIRIQHYLSAKRQYRIPGSKWRADGFIPGNPGTVMEFNGCW